MKILAFHNKTGSKHWRLEQIAKYLNAQTEHEMFVTSSDNWNDDTMEADIVVAQMWRNPKAVEICHEQGAKVVYEADDAMIGVGNDRSELTKLTPEQEADTIKTIQACDLVTVTTEVLKTHYQQWNPHVVVLQNYIDLLWWGLPSQVRKYGDQLRLGWAGSLSHTADLEMISPVIEDILKEFSHVKFIYCGHGGISSSDPLTQMIQGKDLFPHIPPHRREFIKGSESEYWPAKSKTLGFDIGIAPLVADEFNACKSGIKWMEYSANMVPGVYSAGVVYDPLVKHGVTGLLASNQQEWYESIKRLILDQELREHLAKEAISEVYEKYSLDTHFMEWVDAYQTLL